MSNSQRLMMELAGAPETLADLSEADQKQNAERVDKANEIVHAFIRNGSEYQARSALWHIGLSPN